MILLQEQCQLSPSSVPALRVQEWWGAEDGQHGSILNNPTGEQTYLKVRDHGIHQLLTERRICLKRTTYREEIQARAAERGKDPHQLVPGHLTGKPHPYRARERNTHPLDPKYPSVSKKAEQYCLK